MLYHPLAFRFVTLYSAIRMVCVPSVGLLLFDAHRLPRVAQPLQDRAFSAAVTAGLRLSAALSAYALQSTYLWCRFLLATLCLAVLPANLSSICWSLFHVLTTSLVLPYLRVVKSLRDHLPLPTQSR